MKILYFYQYFGTPKGCWSTRVYELTRRWIKEGHEVTVITAPYEKSDIKAKGLVSRMKVDGISLIVINSGDSNRIGKISRGIKALLFAFISVYYSISKKCDIVIASSGPITIGLPLIFAKIFRRRRTVFEVRDLWPAGGIEMGLIKKKWQRSIALWFEKICYQNSDCIVAASIGQEKHIKNRFPDLNSIVIPNASDTDLFGPKSNAKLPEWTNNKKYFTHIGSLGLIHNIRFWLKVANEMKEVEEGNNIILIFFGDGIEREELERECLEKGLNNIKFLGLKPKNELPVWVQNSVATLFSTLDNPVQNTCSPNKIFDSFAAGTPIVQTSTGWIQDLVNNTGCGINIPLSDPKRSAELMIDLVGDNSNRNKLAVNARKLGKYDFNRDLLASKYLKKIESLLLEK